jgi:hypothetical protein
MNSELMAAWLNILAHAVATSTGIVLLFIFAWELWGRLSLIQRIKRRHRRPYRREALILILCALFLASASYVVASRRTKSQMNDTKTIDLPAGPTPNLPEPRPIREYIQRQEHERELRIACGNQPEPTVDLDPTEDLEASS